uniref:NADH-ubiquinone oxidoreductase chain 1 n=1 Tax=Drilonius striatulus TaxID=341977 RepID=A0A0S2MRA0_9COLE|nr:NADH deshydrogenase subunit 1 [Drilonius striatulus]
MIVLGSFIIGVINLLLLIILVLVGVAFLTLFERKVLGYIHIRKGPNKVGYCGILQPFSDAIKLFAKEQTNPFMSNYYLYYLSPVFSLFFSLLVWISLPFIGGMINFNFSILFFLCCSSLGVYSIMLAGWSSNSNYSLLGSLRAVAQSISYEVSLSLILVCFLVLISSLNMGDFLFYQFYLWMFFLSMPLCFVWVSSMLAETNRTPFDFAEGESELVSGFNVEYSSGSFVMIFLAEYSSILFMSFLFVIIFFGSFLLSLIFYIKVVLVSFLFIWVRGSFPRFRYDKLMYLAWKSYLPVTLNYLIFFYCLKTFLFIIIF